MQNLPTLSPLATLAYAHTATMGLGDRKPSAAEQLAADGVQEAQNCEAYEAVIRFEKSHTCVQ